MGILWKYKKIATWGLMGCLIFASVQSAFAIVIDDFDDGNVLVCDHPNDLPAVPGCSPSQPPTDSRPATVLGGERDLVISREITLPDSASTAEMFISGGIFVIEIGSGSAGIGQVIWDGPDNDAVVIANSIDEDIDNTLLNPDDGVLVVMLTDDVVYNQTIELYDTDGDVATYTITLPGGINTTNRFDLFYPFSDFAGIAAVDLNHISAIRLLIDSDSALDASIDVVETTSVREFGDLPLTYTTAFSGSHIPQGLRLGTLLDTETAHQPNAVAAGDDDPATPDVDDEDGVTPLSIGTWTAGGNGNLNYTVNGCQNAPCHINGWIDWNHDGDFDDIGEHVHADILVGNGTPFLPNFTIPATADFSLGQFYARFRLCDNAGECNTVDAADVLNGEVEDYLFTFPIPQDLGDLPPTYGITTRAEDGARHTVSSLFLGDCVDADTDGQLSSLANGDDSGLGTDIQGTCTGNDDEDGITRDPSDLWSDGNGSVNVTVTGGAGCLWGWLDFTDGATAGADDSFDDSLGGISENIIANQSVAVGTQTINFALPLGVADNQIFFARFRLVPDTGAPGCGDDPIVDTTGPASGGEVEDYRLEFGPTAVTFQDSAARSASDSTPVLFVTIGLLLCGLTGLTLARRRRTT